MALPTSGNSISLNQMHVEVGGTSSTLCSLNDSDIRGLISKGSGVTMAFNEWFGASASIPDWSQTMTYGQIVNQTGSGYSVFSYVNRGYRSSAGYTLEGYAGTNGETTYGSMTNQNSNFFSNATINRIRSKAATSTTGGLILSVDSAVANNDTAFSSMSINSNTYNRSAATYTSTASTATWSWSIGAAPVTIANAWSPWPATTGSPASGTCNITFSR